MKKILISIILFIVIFAATLIVKFPYVTMLSYICGNLGRQNNMEISWASSSFSFPVMKLSGVKVVAEGSEIASFDKFEIHLSPIESKYQGLRESCRVSGKIKSPVITYNLTSFPIPESFSGSLGKGTVDASGEYDTRQKKGHSKIRATISEFPNPMVPGSVQLEGDTKTEGGKTDMTCTMSGKNLTGKGTITFTQKSPKTPVQINGLLDIKAGTIPVMLNITGDINNVRAVPVH